MTANLSVSAAHVLNAYLWEQLKAFGVMPAVPGYRDLVPIIPVTQIPAFTEMDGGPPFIVYSYNDPAVGQDWFLKDQTVAYNLYSKDNDTAVKFNNLMQLLFGEFDDSAQRINVFAQTKPGLKEFLFKYTTFSGGGAPQAPESEDGRYQTVVTVSVTYSRDLLF